MKGLYRSKYEAYPFLSDHGDDLRCDFEILTDETASLIGLLRSDIEDEFLREELLKICEITYHINPSLRTFFSVTEEEMEWLEEATRWLSEETKGRYQRFVLTQGSKLACQAHVIRTKFKEIVRMIYRHVHKGNRVPDALIDACNILSNYFFFLALKLNELEEVAEVEYQSRNYK
jgi:ATP:cob(I)alamin adenosyltransferase